jgi:hypothetical protein
LRETQRTRSSDKAALFQQFLKEQQITAQLFETANPCTRDVLHFLFEAWMFEKEASRKLSNDDDEPNGFQANED